MRVVIVGCGYVGLALGRQLLARDHAVVGMRRSSEGIEAVRAAGLDAVRGDLTDPADLAALPDADAVVFAASSGGRGADAARELYVEGLRSVVEAFGARADPPDRLVYTSSTGVYGDHDGGWVDETTPVDPTTAKTRALVEAERVAREITDEYGIDGRVVRFAGLYGPDRYRLERYLEGPVTEGYLNMIHREDATGAVRLLLEPDAGVDADADADAEADLTAADVDLLLAVDDEPVDKWEFADWLADACGVDSPGKRTKAERLAAGDLSDAAARRIETSKRCSNARLHALGYRLQYPTFREGYRAAVRAFRRTSTAGAPDYDSTS